LAPDFQIAQAVAPKNLGMQQDESGTQRESQAENERDRGQAPVWRQLPLPGRPHDFGTVLAGVEKVMLERPVLSEIVPAVVLQLPTVMPELANLQAGEDLTISRGDPKPLLFRGFRYALAAPVVILGERFLRPDDPHRLRMVWGKGRPVGVPQVYRILFPFRRMVHH